ncbi:UNKNOWN [Stylonychia lemnae]|uniref:Uncharacterized protein n=1 Tax=Stylonychia lemnae TaxID=5949 RepID=A0A078B7N3_STYLE|nr:UNKNOWN [Stylonychia lemnae]|eukprot:CDW90520.1 UNKNOWN [Stylonychia lemnae]
MKAQLLHKQNNQLFIAFDKIINVISKQENNQIEVSKQVYQTKSYVSSLAKLDDDIFICGLKKHQIQLLSLSNIEYSQDFEMTQINSVINFYFFANLQKWDNVITNSILTRRN